MTAYKVVPKTPPGTCPPQPAVDPCCAVSPPCCSTYPLPISMPQDLVGGSWRDQACGGLLWTCAGPPYWLVPPLSYP